MPLKRSTIGKPARDPSRMSVAASEVISRHWESSATVCVADEVGPVESLGVTETIRKRHAKALVAEWRDGDEAAGGRIRRMLEHGDGETRLALVEALPSAVPFPMVEAALKGMRRSFLGGSAKGERFGWTVVTVLLGAGLVFDLLYMTFAATQPRLQSFVPVGVIGATAPGLIAWQVMCVHRRMQMAIDTQRQQQYFSRVAVIARTSLQLDPSQYAQPVLHRLREMAPVVELEGGATKKVYRQTVRVFEDAVAHLKSLPIAAEGAVAGPESLPVPTIAPVDGVEARNSSGHFP